MLPANQMSDREQRQQQQRQQQEEQQRKQKQQQQALEAAVSTAWFGDPGDREPSPSPPPLPPEPQPAAQPPPQQPAVQHQFLLCPVDGTLRYVRRGRAARKSEADAEQEIHLQLVQIGVQVHQLQYQSSQKLLQEFDRFAASAPHRHLRPHCRPTSGMQHCQQVSAINLRCKTALVGHVSDNVSQQMLLASH
jgi:hypothetical protein